MSPRTPKQTSQARRWVTISALALLCVGGLGGCLGSNPQIETSKEQGDNSTATDETNSGTVGKLEAEIAALKATMDTQQTTTQSGIFNFAKTTNSALLSGGSVMLSMLSIIHAVLYLGYRIVVRMIPLVNKDETTGQAAIGVAAQP